MSPDGLREDPQADRRKKNKFDSAKGMAQSEKGERGTKRSGKWRVVILEFEERQLVPYHGLQANAGVSCFGFLCELR